MHGTITAVKEVRTATGEVQVRPAVLRLKSGRAHGGIPVGFIPT
jgi:hypothetical protein